MAKKKFYVCGDWEVEAGKFYYGSLTKWTFIKYCVSFPGVKISCSQIFNMMDKHVERTARLTVFSTKL